MAPATEAVVGAVAPAKSGVASATNTVARMVSGALGVAVIGSLVSSLYSSDVEGSLGGLPPEAQAAAEDSIGAANAVAAQLPPDVASGVLATTGEAFTQAMGLGLLVGAVLAAVAAVVVVRFLPAREPGCRAGRGRDPRARGRRSRPSRLGHRKGADRHDTTNRGLRAAGRHAHGRARQQPRIDRLALLPTVRLGSHLRRPRRRRGERSLADRSRRADIGQLADGTAATRSCSRPTSRPRRVDPARRLHAGTRRGGGSRAPGRGRPRTRAGADGAQGSFRLRADPARHPPHRRSGRGVRRPGQHLATHAGRNT